MKIVYLCAKHPPYDGRVHYKISTSLVNLGHKMFNIHPNIDSSQGSGINLIGFKQEHGFFGRFRSLAALYRAGLSVQADAVLVPEPDSLIIAYLMKRKQKGIKVIFDCHEWYNVHFTHVAKVKNPILAKFLNSAVTNIMRYTTRRIDAVITVNDTMKNYFLRFNKNTYTIPSLMDQNFVPDMDIERKDYIYFGQFGNGGQARILIDAVKVLKQHDSSARILIIGGYQDAETPDFNELSSEIKQEQLGKWIEMRS